MAVQTARRLAAEPVRRVARLTVESVGACLAGFGKLTEEFPVARGLEFDRSEPRISQIARLSGIAEAGPLLGFFLRCGLLVFLRHEEGVTKAIVD